MTAADPTKGIRSAFAELVPVALRGLGRMLVDDGSLFCFRATAAGEDGVRLHGRSERYSAMTLIGLARHAGAETGLDVAAVAERLADWAPNAPELGDAGLVLWSQLLRGDPRASALCARIVARRDEVLAGDHGFPSMETGFLLTGLAEAQRAGVGAQGLDAMAADVAARLRDNRDPRTGLFSFGRRVRRKNVHRARLDARLGSFASQVYPTLGFAAYARARADAEAREIAIGTARALCERQGPDGQWWWIYHADRDTPAVRYPVYAVHQDAMGPMALLAAALADGATDRFDLAVLRSLTWFDERPECREQELVDRPRGLIWRAVQRDDPARTGRLGLGRGELRRMGRSAWLGSGDRRPFARGHVCAECRPYHLGWILLAESLFAECAEARGRA